MTPYDLHIEWTGRQGDVCRVNGICNPVERLVDRLSGLLHDTINGVFPLADRMLRVVLPVSRPLVHPSEAMTLLLATHTRLFLA